MTLLSARDFRSISYKGGNVFLNQNTGHLDTRAGNFFSRIVTWAKSKYNPGKINQEYKTAVDSFTTEVKRTHNQIFQKYDPNYSINNENLGRLYQLDKPDKPLATRQVRQVLARLENLQTSLEIANNHSDAQYCRERMMFEMSKHPEDYGHYEPGRDEIERLSARVKDAIVDKIYQHEGWLTNDTAASIVQKLTKEYIQSPTLKMAVALSSWESCTEGLNKEISKHRDLYKSYEPCATDIDKLGVRIRDTIIEEGRRQGKDLNEDDAVLIRDQIIKESADGIIATLSKQKALYKEAVKERTKKAAALRSMQRTAEHHRLPSFSMEQALATYTEKYERAQTQTPEVVTTKHRELGIPELPQVLKQQLSSREIDSKEKLIQASDRYIAEQIQTSNRDVAEQITSRPLHSWYFDCYKKTMDKKPKEIPSDLIAQVRDHIQSMPTLMTYQQGEAYMRQAVIDYINDTQQ